MNNNKKIEAAISSIDGIERASATPFLYSKIRNSLEKMSPDSGRFSWNLVFVLLLVAALNVFTLTSFSGTKQIKSEKAAVVAGDYEMYDTSEY
jgi:hypothetical protein